MMDADVNFASLSQIVAAQRIVGVLAGPVSTAHRADLWQQMALILENSDSEAVAAALAFGLRQSHDIPTAVLLKLADYAGSSTAVLFEEAEGISAQQWEALASSADISTATPRMGRRFNHPSFKKLGVPLQVTEKWLGAGYPELKQALSDLHASNRLTNQLLCDVVRIWGFSSVVATLSLRSGLSEQDVLADLKSAWRRKALFAACKFDANLVVSIRSVLQQAAQQKRA
jgi:hypothetical protein